ncbi:GNAT family N-acetyltransferase [Actinoplanes sp. TBRC 11911]|uniref:GNAT family N-acetyltransferase n=1 Tax=Actinoplanes sp. TBRC 11911 TaxID=2729386 RepID=UPI00145DB2DC|nr:GNAT family N-acetyltransferase [Actinoplanes sp. TBRC 11911]NMO50368.1 GNAT family N-acetyltransferase [Actinoplanes sp. TBRC 11911]
MDEYVAEGRGAPSDQTNVGRDIRIFGDKWADAAEFRHFVDSVRLQAFEDTPRPSTFVPTTTLWWVDGDEYLGRVTIRHRLAPRGIGERNGHIGYDVRPSARRKGHATAMLAAARPWAAEVGLFRALITCDVLNEPSRRVIETNGGVFIDRLDEKLRYWLPVSATG